MTAHAAPAARVLRSDTPLAAYPDRVTDDLVRWARTTPGAVFLAERDGARWRTVTYAEMLARVRRIGAALLETGGSQTRPLAVVAENGIEHAAVALGAMYAGVPVSPLSTGYVRRDADLARLRTVIDVLAPFAAFVPDDAYAARFAAACPHVPLMRDAATPDGDPSRADDAHERIAPDTIAKILFTSGSTGTPKGVITTHRMLSSNQTMVQQIWPQVTEGLVMVDWAPWSHTAAGNKTFGMILRNGGTMFVDAGKPLPGAFEETLRNLREIAPTYSFNVPRGWTMLLDAFEHDEALARTFFSRLRLALNAGAALPESLRARLAAFAQRYAPGRNIPVVFAWGLTETAPMATGVWGERPAEPETIGTPVPGVEVKLAPFEDRFELRVRGPSVTPGYWRDPEATAAAFDDEGFFKSGDAGALFDESDPSRGIVFGGRLAENFKLSSGTWVNAGLLRLEVVEAGGGAIEDVVFAGEGRDDLTALIFVPRGEPEPALRERVRAALAFHNARQPAGSTRIVRALILDEPPNGARGEITDKGSINQRRVLENRRSEVARLYGEPRDPAVIVP